MRYSSVGKTIRKPGFLLATTLAGLLQVSSVVTAETTRDDTAETVRRILAETPLIDGHNDTPWAYRMRVNGHLGDLPFDSDLSTLDNPTHTDLPRLRRGQVGGQFWSVYIPIRQYPGRPGDTSRVLDQFDFVYRMIEAFPNDLAIAYTANDIVKAHRSGRIASLIGIEGGHAIEDSLGTLRMLYKAGARYMTLTHSRGLKWADSATDEARVDGLSPFGEAVVREMNRLGMMVDLSHVSTATMHDTLDVTEAPVIFSHSSAYSVTPHPRNVPDDVLLRVKENDGIVMVTFFPSYVSILVRNAWAEKREELDASVEDTQERSRQFSFWRNNEAPLPVLNDVADHIDHIRNLIGSRHIGLGGDYDGMPPGPVGLEDVSTYPALLEELLRRGYSEKEVAAIAGNNMLRVMEQVELVARRLQKTTPPGDALISELDGE